MPSRRPLRAASRSVDIPFAAAAWVIGFLVGNSLAIVVYAAAGVDDADTASITTMFVAVASGWLGYLGGAWWASQQSGTGEPVADYRISFRAVDLIGVPIGALAQLVLLPVLYLPLTELWPDTFTDERLRETAENLVDRADGYEVALLVLMVCIGAPLVEEIVYRGMIQGSLVARLDDTVGLVLAAVFFAVIHFRPIEYPGLIATGLVLGACMVVTGRIGMSIVAHVAFNVTGLLLVAS
jgi:membrane protease YdiL (CAAX protease family)